MTIRDLRAMHAAEAIREGKRVAIVGRNARDLAEMVDRIGHHYERLTIDSNRPAGGGPAVIDRVGSVDESQR